MEPICWVQNRLSWHRRLNFCLEVVPASHDQLLSKQAGGLDWDLLDLNLEIAPDLGLRFLWSASADVGLRMVAGWHLLRPAWSHNSIRGVRLAFSSGGAELQVVACWARNHFRELVEHQHLSSTLAVQVLAVQVGYFSLLLELDLVVLQMVAAAWAKRMVA